MSTEIEYFAFVSDKNIVENVIVCNSREDFQALMRFIPSMGASARTGAGFGIGANLVGFPRM